VDVEAGTPFEVELASTPTTGYVWEVASLPSGVDLVGSDVAIPADAAVGDGGVQVFRLRASEPGRHRLTFVLKRRWEAEGIEHHVVEIDVRPRST
jgi:predicted secreted protein